MFETQNATMPINSCVVRLLVECGSRFNSVVDFGANSFGALPLVNFIINPCE